MRAQEPISQEHWRRVGLYHTGSTSSPTTTDRDHWMVVGWTRDYWMGQAVGPFRTLTEARTFGRRWFPGRYQVGNSFTPTDFESRQAYFAARREQEEREYREWADELTRGRLNLDPKDTP